MNRRLIMTAALGMAATLGLSACIPLVATGVVTGTLVAVDRRTSGIILEDNGIESRISNRISAKYDADSHVNVRSFNRIVLLTGEVRNDEVRKGVQEIAEAAENVRSVVNETAVAPNSSITDRASDTLLANKVRARLVGDGRFPANIVSTVVERHEVFLMGMVTGQEAEDITSVASTTEGVQRVVKVFEYVDPSSIHAPSATPKAGTN